MMRTRLLLLVALLYVRFWEHGKLRTTLCGIDVDNLQSSTRRALFGAIHCDHNPNPGSLRMNQITCNRNWLKVCCNSNEAGPKALPSPLVESEHSAVEVSELQRGCVAKLDAFGGTLPRNRRQYGKLWVVPGVPGPSECRTSVRAEEGCPHVWQGIRCC